MTGPRNVGFWQGWSHNALFSMGILLLLGWRGRLK